jgi:hypothetical protein
MVSSVDAGQQAGIVANQIVQLQIMIAEAQAAVAARAQIATGQVVLTSGVTLVINTAMTVSDSASVFNNLISIFQADRCSRGRTNSDHVR